MEIDYFIWLKCQMSGHIWRSRKIRSSVGPETLVRRTCMRCHSSFVKNVF